MKLGVLTLSIVLAVLLAACGDGRDDERPRDASTPADTMAAAPAAPTPREPEASSAPGQVTHQPEGGFSIYWPASCDRIIIKESDGATLRAEREVAYNCGGPEVLFSVRKMEMAHDAHGNPAHPRLVVSLIEEQLNLRTMRMVRQRPLDTGVIQGVDVHAEGKDTRQRAWYRGLLVGHDVFLFTIIGEAPDLFERADVQEFLNSFQLD